MSDLDLSALVEAHARLIAREALPEREWGDLTPMQQYRMREVSLPSVELLVPLIREQVAQEIEEQRHAASIVVGESPNRPGSWGAGRDSGVHYGLDWAARIARGGTS